MSFQLITYYFGSKEELWIATVDYLFERYLETGKGLGFTPTGNLHEQFHNHLRLLSDRHAATTAAAQNLGAGVPRA